MNKPVCTCKNYSLDEKILEPEPRHLTEEQAVDLARQCLATVQCEECDLCRYFCPDLCITRDEKTNQIQIDYDYCKGCGLCAYICPKNAITMNRE